MLGVGGARAVMEAVAVCMAGAKALLVVLAVGMFGS